MIGHVAVAIPAHREAAGIGGFLTELDGALAGVAERVTLVVVDDASPDATAEAVEDAADVVDAEVVLLRTRVNRGHGPTVLAAYRAALATGADVVAQVDGDGQFHGADLARVVTATDGHRVALGVRANRADPWFRRALTRGLRAGLALAFGIGAPDANCPLRAFPAADLERFLPRVPPDALVPNVHLAVLAHDARPAPVEVSVEHLPRRGGDPAGTMFGGGRSRLVPRRLIAFSARAAVETVGLALVWRAGGRRWRP